MATATVHELRRLWKPHKQRLQEIDDEHPTAIRFHRACSWLRKAEQASEGDDHDLAILSQWIAFNALYGQWEEGRGALPDAESWRRFLDRSLKLDDGQVIAAALKENRRLVTSIYDDEYLSRFFWREPTDERASQVKKTNQDAKKWYACRNWSRILEQVVERIYLLRCQLVHGAATYNSSLNRKAMQQCSKLLDRLLRAFLLVWIHHGSDEDWGCMCYPPLR